MGGSPSQSDLIDALKKFSEKIGRTPSIRQMRINGPYTGHQYEVVFGSWNAAIREAGLEPNQKSHADVDREDLIEDLQRIDESLFGPPKKRDIDEHGDYPHYLYQEEFSSYIIALQEAGIEPSEKQYRFSDIPTPDEIKGSESYKKLRKKGPSTSSELPSEVTKADIRNGAKKFTVRSGTGQGGQRAAVGGVVRPIYYLTDTHPPELVIRRFFEENPEVLRKKSEHGLKLAIGDHDSSWKEVGYKLIDELEVDDLKPESGFESLLLVCPQRDESGNLEFCFEKSISTLVDFDDVKLEGLDIEGHRPVWGFPKDSQSIWEALSANDAVLFADGSGVYSHYFIIDMVIRDYSLSKKLWAEYEDGIRTEGLDIPWPYLLVGKTTTQLSIPKKQLHKEFDKEIQNAETVLINFEEKGLRGQEYKSFSEFLHSL